MEGLNQTSAGKGHAPLPSNAPSIAYAEPSYQRSTLPLFAGMVPTEGTRCLPSSSDGLAALGEVPYLAKAQDPRQADMHVVK